MRQLRAAIACTIIVLALFQLRQSPATAQNAKVDKTIYLVRHAEKADDGTNNPPLAAEGAARANTLAAMLEHKGIVSIITSDYKRTVQTGAPLAKILGKKAAVAKIPTVNAVASKARAAKGNVLVVHHSNTLPGIIAKLGGPQMPTICDSVYDRLFVLQLTGKQAQFHQTRYGAPSPHVGCQGALWIDPAETLAMLR